LKSALWKKRHSVLLEEAEMARARARVHVESEVSDPTTVSPAVVFDSSFMFNRSEVVNGTFLYNGVWFNVTDFPRQPPPLRSLIPLLRFYDASKKDHICNTDPFEFSDRQGRYEFQGIVAFIYSRLVRRDQETELDDNLVPVYRYWNRAGLPTLSDHFFSLNPAVKGDAIVKQGIVGYIYADPQPTLVPLKEYFSATAGSHLYSVSDDASIKLGDDSYTFQSILGYVQPLDALERQKAQLAQQQLQQQQQQTQQLQQQENGNDNTNGLVTTPNVLTQNSNINNGRRWRPGMPLYIGNQDWSK